MVVSVYFRITIIYPISSAGLNFAIRKIACFAKPKKTISIVEGKWSILTETAISSQTINFNLGEEFEEETPDGRIVKVSIIDFESMNI